MNIDKALLIGRRKRLKDLSVVRDLRPENVAPVGAAESGAA